MILREKDSVEDEARPGRPVSVTDQQMCDKVEKFLQLDRRVTIHQIAGELGLSTPKCFNHST